MRCNNCGTQAHFQFTSHILQLVRIRERIAGSFFDQRLVIETVLLSDEEKLVKRSRFYSLAYRVDSEGWKKFILVPNITCNLQTVNLLLWQVLFQRRELRPIQLNLHYNLISIYGLIKCRYLRPSFI